MAAEALVGVEAAVGAVEEKAARVVAVVRAPVVMEVAVGPGEEKVARVMAILPRSPVRVMEARETPGAVSPSLHLRGRAT